jgi:hypothetical protein
MEHAAAQMEKQSQMSQNAEFPSDMQEEGSPLGDKSLANPGGTAPFCRALQPKPLKKRACGIGR